MIQYLLWGLVGLVGYTLGYQSQKWRTRRMLRAKIQPSPLRTPNTREEQFSAWQRILKFELEVVVKARSIFQRMAEAFPETKGISTAIFQTGQLKNDIENIQLDIKDLNYDSSSC